jgi:hypothetical protein
MFCGYDVGRSPSRKPAMRSKIPSHELAVVLRRPCTSFLFLRKLSKTARVKLRLPGGIESQDLRSNVPASPAVPVAGLAC